MKNETFIIQRKSYLICGNIYTVTHPTTRKNVRAKCRSWFSLGFGMVANVVTTVEDNAVCPKNKGGVIFLD